MDIVDKLIKATEKGKIKWEDVGDEIFIDSYYTTINDIRVGVHVDYTDYVDTNGAIEEEYCITIVPSEIGSIHSPKEKIKELYTLVSSNPKSTDNNLVLLDNSLDELLEE